jgi:NTE family protein
MAMAKVRGLLLKGWTGRRDGREANHPIGFVLSGGGNLGALQIGMMRALLEHDVRPDLIVGCSVGAINGAGLAEDPTLAGALRLERLWRALDGKELMPAGWLPNTVAIARRGEAIHDSQGLRRHLEQSLTARTFEELAVPFQCVATDVVGVREVWFRSGPLIEPILASAALPAVYPAVEIDGVRYLDGGIVDDVPMSRAVELGARTLYVLQVGLFSRPRPEPKRPLDVAVQAYWIARHHRFKRELAAMPPGIDVHLLPTGQTPHMRYNDFTRTSELISLAYEASSAYLAGRELPAQVLV